MKKVNNKYQQVFGTKTMNLLIKTRIIYPNQSQNKITKKLKIKKYNILNLKVILTNCLK
jgi:hypothetical protein